MEIAQSLVTAVYSNRVKTTGRVEPRPIFLTHATAQPDGQEETARK